MMRSAQGMLGLALTVALAAYGSDCVGVASPERAMECCKTMRCHSHHHGKTHSQECCKTMPELQGTMGQPASMQSVAVSPLVFGVIPSHHDCQRTEFCSRVGAGHSHDPPEFFHPSAFHLRI